MNDIQLIAYIHYQYRTVNTHRYIRKGIGTFERASVHSKGHHSCCYAQLEARKFLLVTDWVQTSVTMPQKDTGWILCLNQTRIKLMDTV